MTPSQLVSVLSLVFSLTSGRVVNFEDEGGLPDDFANEVAWTNGRLMNQTLASLMPGIDFHDKEVNKAARSSFRTLFSS